MEYPTNYMDGPNFDASGIEDVFDSLK
jgi:hypothetical protein